MEIDWWQIFDTLLHVGIAFLLALPLGLDREEKDRSAGLRTFPLVAVAACGFMLVGILEFPDSPDARARVAYGIITGIGFIGGGAILKDGGSVSGTATAASLWNTGAIGLAVANRRYEIAIALAILNYAVLSVGRRLKKEIGQQPADDHLQDH